MRVLVQAFLMVLAAAFVSACEPTPPKPKTDFNHERST
jgi:hypothetical protein